METQTLKVTRKMVSEVRRCCHNGHGASIFADGSVMQAISSNDVIARGDGRGGWDHRIAYVSDPTITTKDLQEIFDRAAAPTY